jgi:methionine sulfoxide reductase heme-binding subunit
VGSIAWLKIAIFILSLVPFLRLFVLGFQDRLGVNPIEFITHSTGFWTLTFLCITLAITPLRRLTGWQQLIRLRRMLGLFAFFYACAHLVTYVWFDQWFSLEEIVKDIWKRPFITVGFAAFLLLVPLAVTSTNRMMRRLGRRWSQLHRLVYAIAIFGVVHFWWLKEDKNDLSEPWLFAGIVAVLLLFRLLYPAWQRAMPGQLLRRRSGPSRSATVSRSRTG